MEAFSALLAIYAGNSPVPDEFPTQKPVTQRFDVFWGFFICAWTNAWENNSEAGDLKRHRAHYDVIVMYFSYCGWASQSSQHQSLLVKVI